MKKYKVTISDPAIEDMEEIYHYIAYTLLAPESAISQYNRIADAILTLKELPERIRIMDSDFGQKSGLRQLLIDNYVVLYYIEGDEVTITDVLYGASDIESRLRD